ncbi:MAG TPA: lysophospholipid acyltransferase family protein [Actinomycetes bacterium]|nr:lysophospholipid acyltransferase family protein [Actinomycetes bacterium]
MPRTPGDPVYAAVIRAALAVFRALDLRLDLRGLDNVPASGGAVITINHTGYLDFAIAGLPFWRARRRLVRFMAKQQVFAHPVSGPLMRAMKHIPVDREAGSASFRAALTYLKRGELVGVFPEATISRSFCLKEFKLGAARMAMAAKVPVVPVVLWGSQRLWTKGRARRLLRSRHVPVTVIVGPPLTAAAGEGAPAFTARIVAAMQAMLVAAQADYPQTPRDDQDRWWLPAHLGGLAPTPETAAALDAAEADARASRTSAEA